MTRGAIATANRARARRQIIAAAAAALEVLDLRARYVSEADDRPRLWLERFARGERASGYPMGIIERDARLGRLLFGLSDARADVWEHPTHAEGQVGRVIWRLADILINDCGEAPHDARPRAQTIYAAHLARLEREAVAALLTGPTPEQRARAAADRHAAELALGTATEVSR